MSAADEAVVRRFYEQMNNERKNDLAGELFTDDHTFHDPQIQAADGPAGVAATVSVYQDGVDGHWTINEIFSAGERVVVRWTGSGKHVGEVNGIPATGRGVGPVEAIAIHRMSGGKIAETEPISEVWDTLGFLQQIGVVATA
ncbi:MAG TPA: ester cyclase [Jatrophihabitans sp.]|nr:ester cyclase [Jatrophihabitans sp.]